MKAIGYIQISTTSRVENPKAVKRLAKRARIRDALNFLVSKDSPDSSQPRYAAMKPPNMVAMIMPMI